MQPSCCHEQAARGQQAREGCIAVRDLPALQEESSLRPAICFQWKYFFTLSGPAGPHRAISRGIRHRRRSNQGAGAHLNLIGSVFDLLGERPAPHALLDEIRESGGSLTLEQQASQPFCRTVSPDPEGRSGGGSNHPGSGTEGEREAGRSCGIFTVPFTNNQADGISCKAESRTFQSEEGVTDLCRVRGYVATPRMHDRSLRPASHIR